VERIAEFFREMLGLDAGAQRPGLDSDIDFVLEHSCPKLRLVRGHKKKLRKAVASALTYVDSMLETLPPPLEVASNEALQDLLVKAFFLDQDQFEKTLAEDPDLNQFLPHNSAELFFVMLTMDREVKTVFGSRLQGDIVVKDVALKAVDFSNHKFRAPSETADDFRHTLERGVLQILSHWALENILEAQSRKEELSRLKEEVAAKMKVMSSERQDMVLEWSEETGKQSYKAAQELLEKIKEELDSIQTKRFDKDFCLAEVARVMGDPGDFMGIRQVTLHFDRMGFMLEGKSPDNGDEVLVTEVGLGRDFHRACVPLRCRRSILLKRR